MSIYPPQVTDRDNIQVADTPLNEVSIVIATTTWNSSDIIEQFLDHHLVEDISRVFVMDFGSDDATLDLLRPYCDAGSVELLKLPSLHGKDSSNLLLGHVQRCTKPYAWCIFIDPDEFLSSPETLASDLADVPEEVAVVNLRRFNVTGVRPANMKHRCVPFADLNLKIKLGTQRTAQDHHAHKLNPSWIFTYMPGKVAVRVNGDVVVGHGDHTAQPNAGVVLENQELLHFPIRSWGGFAEKIRLAKTDFDANPHLGPAFGWHWRRWITLSEEGNLASEFLQQFIDTADVERMIQDGLLEEIA